jgi:hypothetical protein
MTPLCTACQRVPVTDNATLCYGCTDLLRQALLSCATYAAELDVTLSRQTSGGGSSGSQAANVPLPYDEDASDAAHAMHGMLTTWVRVVAEQPPGPCRHMGPHPREGCRRCSAWPRDTSAACARWLAERVATIRRLDAAAEMLGDVTAASRRAERKVDRHPADHLTLGPCRSVAEDRCCVAWLRARPDASLATCWNCGAGWDVAERKAILLRLAEDTLAGAATISQALRGYGVEVNEATLRSWVHRRQLVAHGRDPEGHSQYRVGDVLALAAQAAARKARRSA